MWVPEVNDHFEITIRGEEEGQEVDNVLHYECTNVEDGGSSQTFLDAIMALWIAEFIPLLATEYFLINVSMKRITGIAGGTPSDARLTYDAIDEVWGAATDQGLAEAPWLPTYAAATTRKLTGGPVTTGYRPAGGTVSGTEKIFRGSMRLGALPESASESASAIYLTDASRDAVEAAMDELQLVTATDGTDIVEARMIVISLLRNNVVRQNSVPVNVYGWQPVTGMRTNLYLGSQVSRKYRGIGS